MYGKMFLASLTLVVAACAASVANEAEQSPPQHPADQQVFLDTCEAWDEWDKPAPPFKIHGNTYYVGTCGIAAILIADNGGHTLIDTGTEKGAEIVLANIRSLGFDPTDVETLLMSHEHFDHVGGMAFLQAETGAQVYASPDAALVMMLSGVPMQDDPQFGMHDPMKTVSRVMILKGKDQVWDEVVDFYHLENVGFELRAARTPGHTPGALSWQWESCEGADCLTIVFADSLSPVSSDEYRFSDHPEYLAEYYAGLERLGQLECDILLTPHPSHSKMLKRMESGTLEGGLNCPAYAAGKLKDIDNALAKEAASQ